jgi:arylsulfatase A-like enzyme
VARRYYAAISEVDCHVGRLLDELDALGLTEDTVVVYTADHGDTCGDHGMIDKHYILYDCVCRVPLIIRYGQHFAPRHTDAFTVHTLDLGLTLLGLAGLPCTAAETHGYSLLPVLQGGKGARQEAVSTFNGAQFGLYTMRSIRTDGWRYVWNTGDIDELYCETDDPGEVHNRIADPACADILAQLRARLLEVLKAEGDPLAGLGDGYWVGAPHLLNGQKLDT